MHDRIPTRIEPSVLPADRTPAQVAREFRRAIEDGAVLRPAGAARRRPLTLLSRGYTPRHFVDLFGTRFYLTRVRQNPDLRFFVAYVRLGARPKILHPRIFYKDVSLVWRSASHFIRSDDENWIGKGEVRRVTRADGYEDFCSAEETTDLPLELQPALEDMVRRAGTIRRDDTAIELVLRRAPDDRIDPYRDFTAPRERARSNPRNLVNGGRSIARFRRKNDPGSLRFARGFEPDFGRGVFEKSTSVSRLYGGRLRRYRILSSNRRVQYLFIASPRHAWIVPPQATTTELSSYGTRTIDVITDDDLCIPGYEYHFLDDSEDPPAMFSQIPEGFAGAPSPVDPSRADASEWLEALPVIREFRRRVLRR